MNLIYVLLLISTIMTINSLIHTKTNLIMKLNNQLVNKNIRIARNIDLPNAAILLSDSLYSQENNVNIESVSKSQRKELARLEQEDLSSRYGTMASPTKYPSALLVYEEDNQIVGVVGLDCQIYNQFSNSNERFRKIRRSNPQSIKSDEQVVVVLANLAVRSDRRKNGIAKALLQYSYEISKSWGYNDIFLLVDETNNRARKLYKSQGFVEIYRDEEATCIAFGNYSLKTKNCVNLCYKKSLNTNNNIFSFLFNRL